VSELTWEVLAGVVSWAWAAEIRGIRTKSVSAMTEYEAIWRHTKNGRISDMGNPFGCTTDAVSEALASRQPAGQLQRLGCQQEGKAKEVVRDS
jgi:hypothetical protein